MIYDIFLLHNEEMLLKMRLSELNHIVDKFVIIESRKTFTNMDKTLLYEKIKHKFKEYQDKIDYIIIDEFPMTCVNAWDRETYSRNFVTNYLSSKNENDVFMFSDIDEFPNTKLISKEYLDSLDSIVVLQQRMFFYNFGWISTDEWIGTAIVKKKYMKEKPQFYRSYRGSFYIILKAGWHLAYFLDRESIQYKIKSFSHTEYDKDEYNNLNHLKKSMDNGINFLDKQKPLIKNTDYSNLPFYYYYFPECYLIEKKSYKYNVSICAMYRNEGLALKEWLEYHLMIGVEHFYLYNNLSNDNHKEILKEYIEKDLVTYNEYNIDFSKDNWYSYLNNKDYPYKNCVDKYKEESKWIGFIDLDEFICIYNYQNINLFMEQYEQYAGVAIHWKVFGSSGYYMKQEGLVIEKYTLRPDLLCEINRHVKSIVNPRMIESWESCHLPIIKKNINNYMVREDKTECNSPMDEIILHEKSSINHYIRKSKWDYIFNKIAKVCDIESFKNGSIESFGKVPKSFGLAFYGNMYLWEQSNDFSWNCIDDFSMLKFIDHLRIKTSTKVTEYPKIIDWKSYYQNPQVYLYLNQNISNFSFQSMSAFFHYYFLFDDKSRVNFIPLENIFATLNLLSYINTDFLIFLKKFTPNPELKDITSKIILKFYVDYELWLPNDFDWQLYKSKHISLCSSNKYEIIYHWTTIGRFQ